MQHKLYFGLHLFVYLSDVGGTIVHIPIGPLSLYFDNKII